MKKIVWIASYPKSGNTWLRSIISTLIYTKKGEFNFNLLKLIEQYEKKTRYNFIKEINRNDSKKIESKIEYLSKYWIKSQEKIIFNKELNPKMNIFKTHSANLSINNNAFTNSNVTAGCIYIIRDPREVAVSFANHRGSSIDDTIEFMSDAGSIFPSTNKNLLTLLSRWDIHYNSWKKVNFPVLFIKYENLLKNTIYEIEKINRFLIDILRIEIKNIDNKITEIINHTKIEKFQEYEKNFGFDEASKNSNFFRSGKIDSWKKMLSNDQILKIESIFQKTMVELTYK